MTSAPEAGLDEVIHAPHRLRICAFLAVTDEAECGTLRDLLGVSDSVTSKHVRVLQEAGYATLSKPTGRGRVRTWVALTDAGRAAFAAHVAALHEITGG
jgi:DNA-binding MarR family transcriptional regulator